MEKIKVNMSPNPLDVQTIHASQNDAEARQWEFELHNNGELIDTSDVSEQMFFKAYKGGTEQILPENTSTPTTSPFLGDIRYPQGLLTDQEFLYRESPTEEDGNAKIKSIYGNTLVWNQLLNANTASQFITLENGIISLSGTPTGGVRLMSNPFSHISGHKYLFREVTQANPNNISFTIGAGSGSPWLSTAGVIGDHSAIYTSNYTTYLSLYDIANKTLDGIKFTCNIFDLTAMFGAGNEPATLEEFTSLFHLPHYDFNEGSMLNFNGTGLKTVGKNQVANIVRGYFNANTTSIGVDNDSESLIFYAIKGCTYTASSSIVLNRNIIARCDSPNLVNHSPIYDSVDIGYNLPKVWMATWTGWTVWYVYSTRNETVENSAQVEFGSTATEYEPYTSSTLSLPISTYFPNGMNGVNDVHDELNENSAITRFTKVTYNGTESGWALLNSDGVFYITPSGMAAFTSNAICNSFPWVRKRLPELLDGEFTTVAGAGLSLWFKKDSITTVADWKTYLSNNPVTVVYELATPTETPFTTASLVTENAEIPLSNEDGVLIGKCTEELSAEPGFIDAKIKLSDGDGECYSNKIQLHVERSPQ